MTFVPNLHRGSRRISGAVGAVVVALLSASSLVACSSAGSDPNDVRAPQAAAAAAPGASASSPAPGEASPALLGAPSDPHTVGSGGGTGTSAHPTCTSALEGAIGDWSQFGNGQCLVGIQNFYPAKFGASIPVAREAQTGSCAPEGACHIWLDDIPSPALWERIPNDGTTLPSTYDVIVYGPTPGNPYGHIASVDRVEAGEIYVMDTNYNEDEKKAAAPHTTPLAAYGWYHLKSLPKTPWCSGVVLPASIANQTCALGAGVYCGGDHLAGDPTTLYHCAAGHVYVASECGTSSCKVMPDGQSDHCN